MSPRQASYSACRHGTSRPPVWGDIHVTLTPEGSDSTRITTRAMVFPNLFSLIFSPERRILDHFARALH
jgi:hypothetical protein